MGRFLGKKCSGATVKFVMAWSAVLLGASLGGQGPWAQAHVLHGENVPPSSINKELSLLPRELKLEGLGNRLPTVKMGLTKRTTQAYMGNAPPTPKMFWDDNDNENNDLFTNYHYLIINLIRDIYNVCLFLFLGKVVLGSPEMVEAENKWECQGMVGHKMGEFTIMGIMVGESGKASQSMSIQVQVPGANTHRTIGRQEGK